MDDISLRHYAALKAAFGFARSSETSWRQGADKCFDGQAALIRSYIGQRTPCGTDKSEPVSYFLLGSWEGLGDIASLWKSYVDAGYIDTKRTVEAHIKRGPLRKHGSHGMVTMLPLEMAVHREHEEGFQALLDAGASVDAVPSRPWKPSKKPMGIFGFIKHVIRSDETQAKFRAMAAKSMGASPLELAAFECDLELFSKLLDAGEDIMKLPTRQWDPSSRKPMDILGFVDYAVRGETLRSQFGALATRAMMTARIVAGPTPAPVESADTKAKGAGKKTSGPDSSTESLPVCGVLARPASPETEVAAASATELAGVTDAAPTNPRLRRRGL